MICKNGYYFDNNKRKCVKCPDNCLKCFDENECIICKEGYTIGFNMKCEDCK